MPAPIVQLVGATAGVAVATELLFTMVAQTEMVKGRPEAPVQALVKCHGTDKLPVNLVYAVTTAWIALAVAKGLESVMKK